MRKKFYYVQGIIMLGLLSSITSCVDDSESDSVKQVREAYANHLKAQAELLKTQAEADKVKQDAEVTLLKAQAEQVKAQTKLDEANAALLIAQTENEKKKAGYEQKIASEELKRLQNQLQVEVEEAKYKLEQLKITAEIQMLKLQAELDKAKNQKDEILTQAVNEYKILINEANTLKNTIGSSELDLAYLQAVINDVKASNEADTALSIQQYNNWIATTQAKIEADKQSVKNWEAILENAGGESLEKEIKETRTKYEALLVKQSTEYAEYLKANNEFQTGAKKALTDFQNLVGKGYSWGNFPYDRTYYTLEEINVNIASSNKYISQYKKSITDSESQLTALRKSLEELANKKIAAETAKDLAYKAYEEADQAYWSNSTYENWLKRDQANDKYYAAQSAYYDAESNYNSATYQIQNQESNINDYRRYISNEEENLSRYNKQQEAYDGDAKKIDKLIAAYLKEKEVFSAAEKKYSEFEAQVTSMGNYLYELNKIYVSYELSYPNWNESYMQSTSYEYIQSLIKDLNNTIVQNETRIVKYKKDLTYTKELNKKATAEIELKIEDLKNTIATNKAELEIVQKQADAAKVIIDQRMK